MFKNMFSRALVKPLPKHEAPQLVFQVQEIWWCASSVRGKEGVLYERPVLVFRKFNSEMFWGLPLTSRAAKHKPHFTFSLGNHKGLLSQMRILHARRLVRRLGKVSDRQLQELNRTILALIHETDPLRSLRELRPHRGVPRPLIKRS